MYLSPNTKIVEVEGRVTYEERTRGWTLIRFKKELIYIFPRLKNRHKGVKYKAQVFLSLQAFEEFSKKVLDKELPVPIFFYFEEDEKELLHTD